MTDHSITPPQWRVQEWWEQADQYQDDPKTYFDYVATEAARWGADQELEACCTEVSFWVNKSMADKLRAARRPKPPSLKEQALAELTEWERVMDIAPDSPIRRALKQLDD